MRSRHIAFIFIICITSVFKGKAQTTNKSILLTEGVSFYNIKNEFLNSYTYSNFIPATSLDGRLYWKNNIIIGQITTEFGKLNPLNINNDLYNYNYINYTQLSFSFSFYKQINPDNNKSLLFCGLNYTPYYSVCTQHYSNQLYSGATGYRRFKSNYILNLSPTLIYQYLLKKSSFEIQLNYSFFNYGRISDDNYVKQLKDAEYSKEYSFFDPTEYSFFSGIITYNKLLKNNWFLLFSGRFQYQMINYQSPVNSLEAATFTGIKKKF